MPDVVPVSNALAIRLMDPSNATVSSSLTPTQQVAVAQAALANAQRAQDAQKVGMTTPAAASACCGETAWQTYMRAHVKAHAFAGAMVSAYEGERGNCFLGLNTATPTVAIGSGAATGTITVSLPAKTQICQMIANDTNAEDFLCTSLQFNAWEMNKGGIGVTMAVFKAVLERHNMLVPLVGKFWKGTVVISGNFQNLNAASRIFAGLAIVGYNGECLFAGDDLIDEQGFELWGESSRRALEHGMAMGLVAA